MSSRTPRSTGTRELPGASPDRPHWVGILTGVFGVCLIVLGAGVVWVTGGAERVAPAIPLWVAGLAALAVALGGQGGATGTRPPAPAAVPEGAAGEPGEAGGGPGRPGGGEAEEPDRSTSGPGGPDGASPATARRHLGLSERLGLGALGGFLGGLVVAGGVWITTRSGLTRLLGSTIAGVDGWFGLGARVGTGVAWGVAFGVLYHWLPGRGATSRGVFFATAAALYALLYEFPVLRDLGWFAVDLGGSTFLFVLLYHLLWGLALAAVFQWAEVTSEGALDRPLVS